MRKSYRITLGNNEIEILQDEDCKFIKPNFVKELESYGVSLKPAHEPIVVARKPLSEKNVALNVLKWGTGGLNIDDCRIGNGGTRAANIKKGEGRKAYNAGMSNLVEVQNIDKGRFPANVILNSEAGEVLNRQACQNVSSYFYCAKPSLSEKQIGCEENGNPHPTVKPIELCKYLTKMICPPQGTVIDIMAGSGTTGMACAYNNFKFLGIEKQKSYYSIARRRIMAAYRQQQGK